MGKHKVIHTVEKCDEWLSTRSRRKVETTDAVKKRASISKPLKNIGNILCTQNSPPPQELKTHTKQSKLSKFFGRKISVSELENTGDDQLESSEELPTLFSIHNKTQIDKRGDNLIVTEKLSPLQCTTSNRGDYSQHTNDNVRQDVEWERERKNICDKLHWKFSDHDDKENQTSGTHRDKKYEDENFSPADISISRSKYDNTCISNIDSSSSLEQCNFNSYIVMESQNSIQPFQYSSSTYSSSLIGNNFLKTSHSSSQYLQSGGLSSECKYDDNSNTFYELGYTHSLQSSQKFNNENIDVAQVECRNEGQTKMKTSSPENENTMDFDFQGPDYQNENSRHFIRKFGTCRSFNNIKCESSENNNISELVRKSNCEPGTGSLNIDLELLSDVTEPARHSKNTHSDFNTLNSDFDLMTECLEPMKSSKIKYQSCDSLNSDLELISQVRTTNCGNLISTQEADKELENFSLENDSQINF